ncbi:MAG TPA: AAA family ATPase [Planktothrix sp.]|jgi:predicted kinase
MPDTIVTLTAVQLLDRLRLLGNPLLVIIVGIPGSGKTTLSKQLMALSHPFFRLNMDAIRAELCGDESDQSKNDLVFSTLSYRYREALKQGQNIIVDNMNLRRGDRKFFIKLARDNGYPIALICLDTPLSVCQERDAQRQRRVGKQALAERFASLRASGLPSATEGNVFVLAPGGANDSYHLTQELAQEKGGLMESRFDVIGDVHGCYEELMELIQKLGYRFSPLPSNEGRCYQLSDGTYFITPDDRKLALVGDLAERGPMSAQTFDVVIKLVAAGAAVAVRGNHCDKLGRLLKGNPVKAGKGLLAVVDQLKEFRPKFENEVQKFIEALPYVLETEDLIIVHAAFMEDVAPKRMKDLALYGDVNGQTADDGTPVRLDRWKRMYRGKKIIVHGHENVVAVEVYECESGSVIYNIDTGCCFGRELTALRLPEREIVAVPAHAVYYEKKSSVVSDENDEEGGTMSSIIVVPSTAPFRIGHGLPTLAEFAAEERENWIWSRDLRTRDGLTYRLFNYTRGTTYERHWNDVTRVSRGLIVCVETGEVVAAAFPKFFNLGEPISPGVAATFHQGKFYALVKMDGAFGVQYRFNGEIRWATRGSFGSPESQVAQQIWNEKYRQHNDLLLGKWNAYTLMVEIIHPETRVVVKYDYSDLVLIAGRDRFTGKELHHSHLAKIAAQLGMKLVERIEGEDSQALLERAKKLDQNHEGFVFCWPEEGYRIKAKGDRYKELHRLLSGLTPKLVAEGWYDGSLAGQIQEIPEEFRDEIEATIAELERRTHEFVREATSAYELGRHITDAKEFAAWARKQSRFGFIFHRKTLSSPTYGKTIANTVLTDCIRNGELSKRLDPTAHRTLLDNLEQYQSTVAEFLWKVTREADPEGEVRAKAYPMAVRRLTNKLPDNVRGTFNDALAYLRPSLVLEKIRAFVALPETIKQIGAIDVEALFASAPTADQPDGIHKSWVFTQPLLMRSYLDRWRRSGRQETALEGARRILADAVLGGQVEPTLTMLGGVCGAELPAGELASALAEVLSQLESMWNDLPHDADPQILAETAGSERKTTDDSDSISAALSHKQWIPALLFEAWDPYRREARDSFIASTPEQSYSGKFEE